MEENKTELMFYKSDKYYCPNCKYEGSESIIISIPPYEGRYCLKCYAEWIKTCFPKLIKVD